LARVLNPGCNADVPITETEPVGPIKPLTPEDLERDLIQPGHPLFGIVWVNRERMGGTPCFAGSHVPIWSLFDHVKAGDSIAVFLDDFPPITRAGGRTS
jgi:uncharacterized protein (DUF433 family)